MVARLLEVRSGFSVVFSVLFYWNIELSLRFAFFFFLISQLNLISGKNFSLKEMLSLHTSSTRLNCTCQHSLEQKILLKLIRKRSFETLKSFHTFKRMDPRILQNSEWFLTHYFLRRLKHYKDHWVCILKTIFACKSFICVRLFVFFMLQTVLK